MSIKTTPVRTMKISEILHLDTYTHDDNLIISKPPGPKFHIGRVYTASPLIGQGTEFADVMAEVVKNQVDDAIIQVCELAVPDHEAAERMLVGKTHGGEALQGLVASQAKLHRDAVSIGWRDDLPILNRRKVIITVSTPTTRVTPEALEQARATHLALLTNLRACGFGDVQVLDAAGLAGLYRQFADIFTPYAPVELDEISEYKHQIFPPDLSLDFRDRAVGVINDEIYCAAITCKAYPAKPWHGLMNLITGAPLNAGTAIEGGGTRIATPFILNTTIRIANQVREAARVEQAINSRLNTSKLPFKLGTENPEDKLADLRMIKAQCMRDADTNKFVYVSTTAFLLGRSKEQAKAAQSLLASKFSHFKFEARNVIGNCLVRWAQCLPMNFSTDIAQTLDCEAVMSSDAAGTLLPVFGDYQGNAAPEITGRGGIPFITRRGSSYLLDILRTNSTTHGFISAGSGSGKTVMSQYLLENLLAEGVTVFGLDNNRGMLNLATSVGGEFNEFKTNGGFKVSLNPFSGMNDDEFDAQKETITSLLMMMAYEGEEQASGARIAMGEAVKAAWGNAQGDAEITHVLEGLESIKASSADNDLKSEVVVAATNLIPRLKAFLDSPTRGRFFRGKGSLSARNQFTVFDMGGLGDDLHLKRCVVFFVLNRLMTLVKEIPGRKIAFVDEAHALLEDDQAEKALEGLSLKGRSSGLGLWLVLQSLNKMAALPAGRVMLNQAAWMILLAQKEAELGQAIKDGLLAEFGDDPFFVKSLSDVTNRKGQFSEAMIIGEAGYEVVRLYLEPTKAFLYSSEREDRDAIFSLVDQGIPALEAVRQLLGDRSVRRRQWLRSVAEQLKTTEGLSTREMVAEFLEAVR